ncbi:aminotransferase class I/II-fold pyridoxal phosphate-dependent enzyme [candidate division KSB1 bacterium]|nr:aminotransferase class I/II-fold pyridoxal phosphate-dependent enzyme [candidate division KSB1 bacterium]
MEYLINLYNAAKKIGFYDEIRHITDVPYPEMVIDGKRFLCFCSNNYLGLSIHPEVKKAAMQAVERYGIGTCESRWIAGNLVILEDLEAAIADFKLAPASIIFLSGFMANIGIIPAIMDSFEHFGLPTINNENNLIIKDYLCHISLIEGSRLSVSNTKTYKHNDMNHLEMILKRTKDKRKMILTDGIFSMDGDLAPLPEIISLAEKYNAMVLVDDAHATGVIGKNGRGTPEHFNVEGKVDFVMGTLSKALGGLGGFLTGPKEAIEMLRIKTVPYIFSSSIPPEQAAGILAALKIVKEQPELRDNLWRNINHFREGLLGMGFNLLNSETQIMPVFIGDEKKCAKAAKILYEKGIFTPHIIWPAVPIGKARIRCSVIATHTPLQIDRALEAFREMGKEIGII